MVERLVEIDARDFLDGTLTSRRVVQLTGPGTRVSPRYSWRFRVLTKGLTLWDTLGHLESPKVLLADNRPQRLPSQPGPV